jgi:uncharacterized RDD family membrane protein YckC
MPPGGGFPVAGPVSPAGQPLAEPWMRIVARLLDGIILGVVFGAIFAAIILSDDDSAGFGGLGADASFGKLYALALLGVAVGFVWDAVCTKMFGGTPMKLAFGMKVVRADNGGPVEWSHAIIRWAIPGAFSLLPIPVLPGLVNLVILILSLVFIFSKPLRQAVWDLVAKTLVVKAR